MRAVGGSGSERIRATIIGGGVAGLEAMLALREELGDEVDVSIHAPRREFRYRPLAVGEPFGAGHLLNYDLGDLARRAGADFQLGSVLAVDAERHQVFLHDGERVSYDFLLIAPGTRMVMGVPGAITFWGVADEGGVPSVIRALRSGELRRVIFTTPGSGWPLPAYELALLAAAAVEEAGVQGPKLTVVTPEEARLGVFGSRVSDEVSSLLEERGIDLVAGAHPVEFDGSRLRVAPGDAVEADAVVSVPRLEGRRIAGVRRDESGFVPVDDHVRVMGMDRVFAAGDVTTFPVKQGGIAAQQADLAAATIAAAVHGAPEPGAFDPVLRGTLWTGGRPLYLYSRPSGGHGEASIVSEEALPEHEAKIVGRHLSRFLEEASDGEGPGSQLGIASNLAAG
jgi:sulfide:quinone oxidoreductase